MDERTKEFETLYDSEMSMITTLRGKVATPRETLHTESAAHQSLAVEVNTLQHSEAAAGVRLAAEHDQYVHPECHEEHECNALHA